MTTTQKRIAIVGGGPAALSAAWEILSRDATSHVTIYQLGWRLGGKLATSRNPDVADRIEEHGIHILFGAYENTFHVLRNCHGKLGTDWKLDFTEHGHATLMEPVGDLWRPWSVTFPRLPGDPGDAIANDQPGELGLVDLAKKLLLWLMDFAIEQVSDPLTKLLVRKAFETVVEILEAVGDSPTSANVDDIAQLLGKIMKILKVARAILKVALVLAKLLGMNTLPHEDRSRRLWVLADLGTAAVVGLLRAAADGQSTKDLDEKELRQWLSDNAPAGSLSDEASNSAPLRMVYEVVFAYEDGNVAAPSIAAGTAVRALLRLLFDYRGAFAYRMKSGSEALVNALYNALLTFNNAKERIEFEFFHRLDGIELSSDGTRVETLKFTRQATPSNGYNPLDANGRWPDHPNYSQLVEGNVLELGNELASQGFDLEARRTASTISAPVEVSRRTSPTATEGFDDVVLGVSMGGLLHSAITSELTGKDLVGKSPAQIAFHDMMLHQAVVATQSAQLWFSQSAQAMGWAHADDLVGTYEQPFGNWADLSLTIENESWPIGQEPKHVAYLAGPLEGGVPSAYAPVQWRLDVATGVQDWLETKTQTLWPNAHDSSGFRWDWLVDPGPATGSARLATQWFRSNRNEGELYTLTPPSSTKFRIGAHSGYSNLYLAGDWTDNTFNVGALESAVMSGRQAARAVLGVSFLVYGEA
jgi:uncharacterized protein with NAD-binding domain and iron-sulfur cluster